MVARVLLGKFPDGGYGLRTSEPAYAVTSNPVDNEKLLFNSDWPALLPIYQLGSSALNNNSVTVTYPSLGYTPHCAALVYLDSRGWQQYMTSNCLKNNKASSGGFQVSRAAMDQLNWEGDVFPNVRVSAFSDHVTLYSNVAATIIYIIYRMQAF